MGSSAAWHQFHQTVLNAVQTAGAVHVASMSEMVKPSNQDDADEMQDALGEPWDLNSGAYGARRQRDWYTVPKPKHLGPDPSLEWLLRGCPRWLGWPAHVTAASSPPCVVAHFPDLVAWAAELGFVAADWGRPDIACHAARRAVQAGVKPAQQGFAQTLREVCIRDARDGLIMYPGVMVVAAWFGHDARSWGWWRCEERVEGVSVDARCGVQIYCHSCATVIRMLGRSWHLGTAAKVCTAWALEAERMVSGMVDSVHQWKAKAHECGVRCRSADRPRGQRYSPRATAQKPPEFANSC